MNLNDQQEKGEIMSTILSWPYEPYDKAKKYTEDEHKIFQERTAVMLDTLPDHYRKGFLEIKRVADMLPNGDVFLYSHVLYTTKKFVGGGKS